MKRDLSVIELIRPDLKNIQAYSSARDEFSTEEKMIFLDANENPFDNGLNRYPDPYQQSLKSKISEVKKVPSENMLLGNGSDEVIDLIVRLFCIPFEDKILTFPPTYGMYKVVSDLNAVKVLEVNLDKNFQIDIEALKIQLKQNPKLIFICSPNNPSGNSIEKESIEFILKNFNGIVIIDEAYHDFSSQKSWSAHVDEYPNLIILQTFSKAYGMAGARLGLCFANPLIIEYLNRIKPPYNVNQLTQVEILKSLEHKQRIDQNIETLLEERQRLAQELEKLAWVKYVYPSDSNFLLIKVDDANKRYNELLKQHIVVRNRHNLPGCENCLRISVGTPKENLILIETLKTLT
jgi:histidinol-phosphate aminotransferase